MSKVAIAGDSSGTGTFTIKSPNSNSDRTLNLPDVSGTLLSNASTAGFPAGSVLQVVQASTTTAVTNSTNTYTDTGLTATITPTSASSKILVLVSQACYKSNGNINNGVNIKLFRGATDLGRTVYVQGFTGTTLELFASAAFEFLDSPATASAVTYKTQFANNVNAALSSVQPDSNGRSTITLMEIAA
jgi:hypothetical protein